MHHQGARRLGGGYPPAHYGDAGGGPPQATMTATWGVPPPEPLVTFCQYMEKVLPVHGSSESGKTLLRDHIKGKGKGEPGNCLLSNPVVQVPVLVSRTPASPLPGLLKPTVLAT